MRSCQNRIELYVMLSLLCLSAVANWTHCCFAEDTAESSKIRADIWPDSEQPLLKIHPTFNDPRQIKYRLTLADDWPSHTPLAYAFAQGDRAMVRVLLKQGADPNEVAAKKKVTPVSPMQAAIARQDPEAVRFLLKVGATPTVDHLSEIARVQTAKPQIAMTRLILECGVNPINTVIVNHFAQQAAPEAFALLFEHGAQINNKVGSFQMPPTLCSAIASIEKVRVALKHGADPNQGTHRDDQSPLHFCAQRGSAATVDLLVAHGAKVNVKNRVGETPIERALVQGGFRPFYRPGNTDLIRALLRHGAETSVAAEVAVGDIEALRARKKKGDPIRGLPKLDDNQVWYGLNETRSDLISIAALFRQAETLNWLLDNGIRETIAEPPNIKTDRLDLPALVVVAFQSDAKSVEVLLKHGADPNEPSPRAVYVAAAFRPLHAVLASAVGAPRLHVPKGKKIKLGQSQRAVIKTLLAHGADPDLKNGYGQTARKFAESAFPDEKLFDSKD